MMTWVFPLALLVTFECVADVLAKQWSLDHEQTHLAVGALLAYLVANTFWLFALKNGSGLTRGAILFSVASALVATFIGLVFYKESLSRTQFVGLGFGLVSIILIFEP